MAVTGRLSKERKELLDWFRAQEPEKEPFRLCPWIQVMDPVKFYDSLKMDLKDGPSGPRANTGAFFAELELYRKAKGK